jgi:non-ribosomal peptide synthetase-like protein
MTHDERMPLASGLPARLPSPPSLLHHVFEAQADRRPGAPAIVSGADAITYAELDALANRLARHLRASGAGTGARVGLFVERSPEAIVAILGILKAGAAYVPLDPSHPVDRLRHVAAEAGLVAIACDTSLAAAAADLGPAIVTIDDANAAWPSASAARLDDAEVRVSPGDLAYVLYTSGSTGRPKGVMAEHRNVVSFIASFNQVLRLTSDDRVFQGFSLGFDGSVEEIWMALSNGGVLAVPPRGSARFGNDLARLITGARATVFSTVPTSLSMISEGLPTVRLLIVSGEPCPKEAVDRWAAGGRRMLNVYGPTETTVNATAAECLPGRPVTIGKPLPGYATRILDEEGNDVAEGAQGELFISGPGVARGYLEQPELTRKHFVDLPARGERAAVRAYRTGDLVSRGDDGELRFAGRADNQVKVRGYRIELSEIEAVLVEHPRVRAAVATVVERDGAAEIALHAVADDPAAADTPAERSSMRALLAARLPSYMVPAFLDVVAELPTLASGKVDRKRLPPPRAPLLDDERPIVLPRSDLEAAVFRVYARIFKTEAISIDDDFFTKLGGYSLLAARLVSEVRRELSLHVALRDVYEHPTIAALAAHIASRPEDAPPREADGSSYASGVNRLSSRQVFEKLPASTRVAGRVVQCAVLYVIYGLVASPLLMWFVPFRAWEQGSLSLAAGIAWWALGWLLFWPALLALSIAVKWLVIGRYRPGAYPLWGSYYVRWWVVSRFQMLAGPAALAGTPLLALYYRCMGARVGRNCTIDTPLASIYDLLSIGDDTSIGSETQILGYRVEDGLFLVGSIDVGSRCFVGIHSTLGLNARMGNDARLDDLSLLPDGASMAPAESRGGSPARARAVAVPEAPATPWAGARAAAARRRALFGALHLVSLYLLALALMPALAPSALLCAWAERRGGGLGFAASLPVAGVVGMVAFCLWLPVLKAIILPRARPGVYRVDSLFYVRKWLADTLMKTSQSLAKPLYTTIYLPAWLRLLGARIGRRAEISTVSQISPELTDIGDHSFFADGSMIAGRRVHRGWLELTVSRIGRRSFVGNSAILPVGTSLGDGCLLGCLSAPPEGTAVTPDGTEWLGSPSFALPHRVRVEGFDASVTHEPTRTLIAQRLAVDALRIAIPSGLAAIQLAGLEDLVLRSYVALPRALFYLVFPALAIATATAALLCVVATKKILVGTFHPTVKPLWSMFVWLNEAVNGAYETVAAPILLFMLGTPYCVPWLRMMGCKIGRHVYVETTLFSEFDLVHVGDHAALNAGAVIQNHLFEDRIMKASTLRIGEGCSVGPMAVVLYDTEMQPGSTVGPLSLLMKGETVPARTRWLGIPTAESPLLAAFSEPPPALLGEGAPLVEESA